MRPSIIQISPLDWLHVKPIDNDITPHRATNMSSHISRASKRLRVAQQPTAAWMCNSCKRSFASTSRSLQTPEQQRKEAEKTTHFGYETVAESLKASKGKRIHSAIHMLQEQSLNDPQSPPSSPPSPAATTP
jgi:ribosomal protein L37AE/L43A